MAHPRFFLLRHGQSTFNASWDRTGVDPGDIDARLTDLGHEQVRGVADRVRALGVDLVVTSPTARALETTCALFDTAKSEPSIVVDALVRDRFSGDSCDYGRSPEELASEFPAFDFAHLNERWWFPEGQSEGDHVPIETREAFAQRIDSLRGWLMSRPEQSILVVGHLGTFRLLAGVPMANCQLLEWDVALGLGKTQGSAPLRERKRVH